MKAIITIQAQKAIKEAQYFTASRHYIIAHKKESWYYVKFYLKAVDDGSNKKKLVVQNSTIGDFYEHPTCTKRTFKDALKTREKIFKKYW